MMEKPFRDIPEYFQAFIRTAQYIPNLTSRQDIISETGRVLVSFYGADLFGFFEPGTDGGIEGHNWILPDGVQSTAVLTKETEKIIAGVLETGVLAAQQIEIPEPFATVFLPIIQENQTAAVMLVGHRTPDPIPNELLNIYLAVTGLVRDITERRKAEDAVRQANAYNRGLIETSPDPFVTIGPDGKITDANVATEVATGYQREQLIGTDFSNYFTEPDKAHAGFLQVFREGQVRDYPLILCCHDGHAMPVLYNATVYRDESGRIVGIFAAAREVTGLKEEERKLKESETRFSQVAESAGEWIWEVDADGLYTYSSPAVEKMLGYRPDEVVGRMHFYDLFAPEAKEDLKKTALEAFATKVTFSGFINPNLHKSGNRVILETSGVPCLDEQGRLTGYRGADTDITGRRQAEEALKKSEEKFRYVFDWANDAILLHTLTTEGAPGRFIEVNLVVCRMLGYTRDELFTMGPLDIVPPEFHPQLADIVRKLPGKDTFVFETRLRRKDGTTFPVESSGHLGDFEGKKIWISHIRDITGRKMVETELARVNRALLMCNTSHQMLVHITDETALMNEICRIAVEVGGYRMAWIGFAELDEAKTVRPVAHAGFESGYIETAHITWADSERGRGPGGTAIRTGKTAMARNITVDPTFAPWREEALLHGYQAVIVLPLTSEGRTFGALAIYAIEADAFDTREVEILTELADDLAFGITTLRTRAKRDLMEEALRESDNRYHQLVDNTDTGFVVIDDRGIVIEANEPYMHLMGAEKKEDLIGHSVIEWTAPEEQDSNAAAVALCSRQGIIQDFETIYLHRNGTQVHIVINATTQETPGGKRIVSFCRNITERKKAEEALRKSRAQYREMVENIGDVILTLDLNGTVTYISPVVQRLFGYTVPEVVGQHFSRFVHPEDITRVFEGFRHRIEGEYGANEFRLISKDGEERYVHTTQTPTMRDDVVTGFNYVMRDITVQKKAEEKIAYQAGLLAQVNDALVASDEQFRLTAWNAAAEAMYGWKAEEVIGRYGLEVTHTEWAGRDADEMRRKMVEMGGWRGEVTQQRRDGTRFPVEISSMALHDESGRISGWLSVNRDITERKQIEDRITRLSALERAPSRFAGS